MCGIAGIVGKNVFADKPVVERMIALMAHRGPDGDGVFAARSGFCVLGHRRLAIIDLSDAASQPMRSPDGRYVLVCNGEIYNFRELRDELAGLGHSFVSTGDTEVLLHGLMQYGESFIKQLNGVFAFALWDCLKNTFLLARDHLGVKPVYYVETASGKLIFASEIKALLLHPAVQRDPDFGVMQQHLAFCHASGSRTMLKNIKRLQPGHSLYWDAESCGIKISRFWPSEPFPVLGESDYKTEVATLGDELRSACARQMVADVPVGVLLSGGLDSSVIAAHSVQHAGTGLRAFTITYSSDENRLDRFVDDTPYARLMAKDLGLDLTEIELRPDVAGLWPRLVGCMDEPVADPAAITCYLICKQAREAGIKVLLSGQGGDELFGGYPRYMVMNRSAWMERMPLFLRRGIASLSQKLPGAAEGFFGAWSRRLRRGLSGVARSSDERFLELCAATPQVEITRVLSRETGDVLGKASFMDDCMEYMEVSRMQGMRRYVNRDIGVYLPNHNLLYSDKTSMFAGVEMRVPLLDLRLVNRAMRYPDSWLVRNGCTKALFRDASRGVVPDTIIDRPKAGFGAPYRKWLRYDLAEMWNDLCSESSVRRRGWFDYAALQDARNRSQSGRDDLYMLQWSVLTMEIWAREFLDR